MSETQSKHGSPLSRGRGSVKRVYRLEVKCMAAQEFHFEVTRFEMLTPTVFELDFVPIEKVLAFKAGQFVSVIVPKAGPQGRDLRRAYSIASPPQSSSITLCVKLVEGGPGTNYLYKLRTGDRLRGFAPYGDFIFETPRERSTVFVSTGTGIAPFRSMLLSQGSERVSLEKSYLLLGVRTEDEILYPAAMKDLLGRRWIPTVSQPTRDGDFFRGRVTDVLKNWAEKAPPFEWNETDFYLCGNGAMISEVTALLIEKGVPKEQILKEKYF